MEKKECSKRKIHGQFVQAVNTSILRGIVHCLMAVRQWGLKVIGYLVRLSDNRQGRNVYHMLKNLADVKMSC